MITLISFETHDFSATLTTEPISGRGRKCTAASVSTPAARCDWEKGQQILVTWENR